ncbi:MAG: HAD-IC family P-type ATPase [Firmicutes bacterium]|nr:HAD-IC family P-type ATPase [Bacillota bacterium]
MPRKKQEQPTAPPLPVITGLSQAEIAERVAGGLVNGDQNIKTKTVWQILASNLFTFFNLLFLILAVILFLFSEKTFEGMANFGFLGVVISTFVISILQELKAKRTIDKLSLLSAPRVASLRDGEEVEIAVKDIVMDEIVILRTGNQICADAVVVHGSLEVNESLITGESDPIMKKEGDELLSGSFIISGSAHSKVIRIGKDNYATKISAGAKYIKAQNSVILRSVRRFIKMMAMVILPLGATLFSVKYFGHQGELNETVRSVIGNLIGMIPAGLMFLTTGVFSLSAIRLSRYKALPQDLFCTEALARVDVLCLDKTGTITEGSMEVTSVIPYDILEDETLFILKNLSEALNEMNPTALAVKEYVKDIPPSEVAESVIHFSSARKWSSAKFKSGTYVMGAAEFILKKMSKKTEKMLALHSEKGNRVLVLAKCGDIKDYNIPSNIALVGYIVIADKIRAEAPDTIKFFAAQGVAVKVISGDNPITVRAVAKRAGIKGANDFIDATTLKTEEELEAAAVKYTVFGRVTPDQKLQLIKALKKAGHTVAMTGDGVNDVLALREADCSVAMAAGSDAAKNVSQLVLLDSNFASMPKIVAEGRRSINNLERSSSLFLVKTLYNFLFALIFMILNEPFPFEPRHFTLLGLVTIGLPGALLALEPNSNRVTGSFFSKVVRNAIPAALTVVSAVVATVLLPRLLENPLDQHDISSMCLMVTACVCFAYLIMVTYPYNALRITMLFGMVGLFALAHFANFGQIDITAFFGLSTVYTDDMLMVIMPIIVLSIPILLCFIALIKQLAHSEKFEKLFARLYD